MAANILKRVDTWEGLVKGDPVHVCGMRGGFSFIAAYVREDGTVDAVQVAGSSQRAGRLRVVAPEFVTSLKARS